MPTGAATKSKRKQLRKDTGKKDTGKKDKCYIGSREAKSVISGTRVSCLYDEKDMILNDGVTMELLTEDLSKYVDKKEEDKESTGLEFDECEKEFNKQVKAFDSCVGKMCGRTYTARFVGFKNCDKDVFKCKLPFHVKIHQ